MGRRWKIKISDCIESWKERALGTIEEARREERKWKKERKVSEGIGVRTDEKGEVKNDN